MSLALDAIILFTAVVMIWSGAHKGFIRSVMGFFGVIVAAIAAYAYTPVFSAYIKETFLLKPITDGIHETLKSFSYDINTDLYNLDRLAEDIDHSFIGLLERYNVAVDSFLENIRGMTACSEGVVRGFAEEIAAPTASIISSTIAFIVLFVGIALVISILSSLLDFLFNLPVLKTANTLLGLLFGVAEAAFSVIVLASVLSVLVTGLGSIDPSLFGADVVENTTICKKILEFNAFESLKTILN